MKGFMTAMALLLCTVIWSTHAGASDGDGAPVVEPAKPVSSPEPTPDPAAPDKAGQPGDEAIPMTCVPQTCFNACYHGSYYQCGGDCVNGKCVCDC